MKCDVCVFKELLYVCLHDGTILHSNRTHVFGGRSLQDADLVFNLFSCQSIDVGPCKTFWCLQALNQKPFDTVVEVVVSQPLVRRTTC